MSEYDELLDELAALPTTPPASVRPSGSAVFLDWILKNGEVNATIYPDAVIVTIDGAVDMDAVAYSYLEILKHHLEKQAWLVRLILEMG